jgi:hypothetical protein
VARDRHEDRHAGDQTGGAYFDRPDRVFAGAVKGAKDYIFCIEQEAKDWPVFTLDRFASGPFAQVQIVKDFSVVFFHFFAFLLLVALSEVYTQGPLSIM